jgi:hypothetical protein
VSAEDGPGPEIGYTGARFGGSPRRKTRKRKSVDTDEAAREAARRDEATEVFAVVEAATAQAADDAETGRDDRDGPAVGYTGARFGGAPRRRKPTPAAEPAPQVAPPAPPLPPQPGPEPAEQYADPTGSLSVRPYVFTRGRTRSRFELSIEALVSVVPAAPTAHMDGEHHAVIAICHEPRSVAEIAAVLGVPLGVARVLVGDLAAAGAVTLHRTAGAAGPDLALMERVLSGLRRL